jgi:hypothetical protein
MLDKGRAPGALQDKATAKIEALRGGNTSIRRKPHRRKWKTWDRFSDPDSLTPLKSPDSIEPRNCCCGAFSFQMTVAKLSGLEN